MNGSAIFYVLPATEGWRLLRGTIVNANRYALVVRERNSGVQRTINPNWLVSYDWSETKTTAEAAA